MAELGLGGGSNPAFSSNVLLGPGLRMGVRGGGNGAFSAVSGVLTPIWRKVPSGEEGGCPGSEALGVLMNGGLQFGEN